MRCLPFLALAVLSCTPDLTQGFVGDWTVASGTYTDRCSDITGTRSHKPGDTTLTIASIDHTTLSVVLGFQVPMESTTVACDLTAVASSETSAALSAKACVLNGNHHDVIEGSLKLTPSGALLLDYLAAVGRDETCDRTATARFVPK